MAGPPGSPLAVCVYFVLCIAVFALSSNALFVYVGFDFPLLLLFACLIFASIVSICKLLLSRNAFSQVSTATSLWPQFLGVTLCIAAPILLVVLACYQVEGPCAFTAHVMLPVSGMFVGLYQRLWGSVFFVWYEWLLVLLGIGCVLLTDVEEGEAYTTPAIWAAILIGGALLSGAILLLAALISVERLEIDRFLFVPFSTAAFLIYPAARFLEFDGMDNAHDKILDGNFYLIALFFLFALISSSYSIRFYIHIVEDNALSTATVLLALSSTLFPLSFVIMNRNLSVLSFVAPIVVVIATTVVVGLRRLQGEEAERRQRVDQALAMSAAFEHIARDKVDEDAFTSEDEDEFMFNRRER